MDTDADQETNVSVVVNVGDSEAELNKVDLLEGISSNGEVIEELRSSSKILSRVELDIACSSEKLVNLNILMMHVATRESEFETFAKERGRILDYSVETALEFDLLSGLLVSEVIELEIFITTLQADFYKARELISSYRQLGKTSTEMEEKLLDSEDALKQSQDQISEIKKQSAKFQRAFSSFDKEGNWIRDKDTDISEDDQFSIVNAKIKMQTAEQQRHILRNLAKSLEKEMDLEEKLMDLEVKLTESRQVEEMLKFRLRSFEQEVLYTEEEAMDACERRFEAENAAEVLKGISKELLGRLQIVLFNMNGSVQRETGLRSKLDVLLEQLEVKESVIADLSENLSKAEARADGAEARRKLLTETNAKLKEDLKVNSATSEKVESLERLLRESDIRLQHAVASAEASLEKQNMLYSTIRDMENLIEDLKLKVSKANSRADSAEEKLIILSEANAGLTEEISFLRERLECLEASLHQAEETKLETAKDIGIRTKVITNLVMQLAIERERLHQQISSLATDNKVMVVKLQQTKKDPSIVRHDSATAACQRESKEEVTALSAAVSEEDKTQTNVSAGDTEVASVDLKSELGTLRRVDAGLLNNKHFFIAMLIVLISAAYCFQKQNYPF